MGNGAFIIFVSCPVCGRGGFLVDLELVSNCFRQPVERGRNHPPQNHTALNNTTTLLAYN